MTSEQIELAGGNLGPREYFDAWRQPTPFARRRDDPSPAQAQILHALSQSGNSMMVHRCTGLDLDRQDAPSFNDQQIDLRAGMCPPEEQFWTNQPARGKRRELFDNEAFERSAPFGPGRQLRGRRRPARKCSRPESLT